MTLFRNKVYCDILCPKYRAMFNAIYIDATHDNLLQLMQHCATIILSFTSILLILIFERIMSFLSQILICISFNIKNQKDRTILHIFFIS